MREGEWSAVCKIAVKLLGAIPIPGLQAFVDILQTYLKK